MSRFINAWNGDYRSVYHYLEPLAHLIEKGTSPFEKVSGCEKSAFELFLQKIANHPPDSSMPSVTEFLDVISKKWRKYAVNESILNFIKRFNLSL